MWVLVLALLAQSVDYEAEGIKALDLKHYAEAADLFGKAVAADPRDYAAQFQLALAFSLQNKDVEAVPHYKSALELKPGLYEAQLNLGISLLRLKQPAEAAPYLKSAAEQKPKEARPAYYFAQALLDHAQFPEAEAAFATAVALNPLSAPAEAGLAEALEHQGKLAEAEPHFRKAASIDPAYRSGLLELAQKYEDQKAGAQAIAIYREFPDNPGAQERMGALLAQAGNAADAIPALEMAVAKSPTPANRIALAQAYVKMKQADKAVPLAAQALQSNPNDFELRMFYGRLLRDQKKYADAAPQFVAASKLQPDSPQPWNEITTVMIASEQYPQALAALDHVFALNAQTPSHYYFRAISYDHLHQLKEALANYTQFLAMSKEKFPDEEWKARQRSKTIQRELDRK